MKWLKLRSKNLFERIGFFLEINKHKSITVLSHLKIMDTFASLKKFFKWTIIIRECLINIALDQFQVTIQIL
jgi:hypothetical protein